MADFNLTKMAVNMFCPGNVVQLDDAGLPSVLVWIPAFKNSDVLTGGDDSIHPAFIVNGVQIPGFYYSKYQNVVHNGKAYSLPAEAPKTGVSFNAALEYCESKGYGWHRSTAAEWAAIALVSKLNGHLPKGNNCYGRDNYEEKYQAIPCTFDAAGNRVVVSTGTGPVSWSHDNTMSGIWDMNGNVWEVQSGFRTVYGEIQILANNDAADPDNPQNSTSTCWKAINAADGTLVDPECTVSGAPVLSGDTVRLDYLDNIWTYSTNITNVLTAAQSCAFYKMACSEAISDTAKVLLRALALLPDTDAISTDYENANVAFHNGHAERYMGRGGRHTSMSNAGVFSIYASTGRDTTSSDSGFRAAYIPNI